MENTLERIAKCRYTTKMDKRLGFSAGGPIRRSSGAVGLSNP